MSEPVWKLMVVVTTNDDQEELNAIAAEAVKRKLAACAQVLGPITSHYVWDGKTETSSEYRCEFKTSLDSYPQLETLILELHHYEEPEILCFQIDGGSDGYLKWVNDSVQTGNNT